VGASLVEHDKVALAENLLRKAHDMGIAIHLPTDHVVCRDVADNKDVKIINSLQFGVADIGMDIGPETIKTYAKVIDEAAVVFCNGPMGMYEKEAFQKGTEGILQAMADSQAFTIVGGGDSIAALNKVGLLKRVSFVSSGGGAGLELLEGKVLPGLQELGYYEA